MGYDNFPAITMWRHGKILPSIVDLEGGGKEGGKEGGEGGGKGEGSEDKNESSQSAMDVSKCFMVAVFPPDQVCQLH